MRDRLSVPPDQLFPRRLAARALGMVLEQLGLTAMAVRLNPDDPTQALPGAAPGEVSFYEDFAGGRGPVVATVLLDGARARVLVERIDRLVRRNHLRDFRPAELGIVQRRGAYDVDVVVDLAEVLEVEGPQMRTARQRPVMRREHRIGRAPTVIRAFGSSR